MRTNDNGESGSVALYWDFENLHAGLMEAKHGEGAYAKQDNRFKVQEPLVDVQALVELGASFGPVAINRAYGNWQYFGRYRDALLQGSVELIQLFPPGASAKNGADIKLCLDATEDLSRFAHIRTVIVVGGDSDYMPVAQKIKAAGRTLIGIGNRKNTNKHWAKSCHEFRYYDTSSHFHYGIQCLENLAETGVPVVLGVERWVKALDHWQHAGLVHPRLALRLGQQMNGAAKQLGGGVDRRRWHSLRGICRLSVTQGFRLDKGVHLPGQAP